MRRIAMHDFDYEKVAREAGIAAEALGELSRLIRREFPDDEMMYELHLLRACRAIREGRLTMEDALRDEQPAGALAGSPTGR